MKNFDVIIIGNGMAGATFATALAQLEMRVAIIDKAPLKLTPAEKQIDGRKIALSYGSEEILKAFGLWSALAPHATPIEKVHISAQGQFGRSIIDANDIEQTTLGAVLPAEKLIHELQQAAVAQSQVHCYCPASVIAIDAEHTTVTVQQQEVELTLSAQLIIAADGVMSKTRQLLSIETEEKDYQQTAIVSSIQLQQTHHNMAYQRFSKMGTLALLPMQNNHCGFVCTASNAAIKHFQELGDGDLLEKIQQHFGYRLGKFVALGPRFSYPLKKIVVKQPYKNNILLLGNAAHNLSPVAAQGFNLALQDIFCLVNLLRQEKNIADVLANYVEQRQTEQNKVINFTEQLMELGQSALKKQFLGAGLLSLECCLPIKQKLAQQAAGITPQLKQYQRSLS